MARPVPRVLGMVWSRRKRDVDVYAVLRFFLQIDNVQQFKSTSMNYMTLRDTMKFKII